MTARMWSVLADVGAAALVAALVLAVYVGALLAGGGVQSLVEPGPVPVLAGTVLVALLVQPVHVRLRRVLRHALGVPSMAPFELLRRLPETVTGELPAEEIPQYMVRVLADGLRTHRAELWLHVPGGHRLAAAWPPHAAPPHAAPPDEGVAPAPAPGVQLQPIRLGDRELAVLLLEHRPPRALSRLERRLLDAYAAQAGQVVTMLVLRADLEDRRRELAERTTALREARAQLVETRHVERRLLERDLHDGAQQQLLALELGVRLARQVLDRDPDRARELIHRSADRAGEVTTALATLSSSLYPRLLETEGPAAALRAALAGGAVPIIVQDGPPATGALPAREAAESLYFVAVEAAQNAVKHADAPEVRVALHRTAEHVVLTVTDRGRGFATRPVQNGAGLRNMADRVGALGGRLHVESHPRHGTVVTATVPTNTASTAIGTAGV